MTSKGVCSSSLYFKVYFFAVCILHSPLKQTCSGLSNKAITPEDMTSAVEHTGTAHVKDYEIPYQVAFAPASLQEPPLEEVLLQVT